MIVRKSYQLLGILMEYAPNGDAQFECSQLRNSMIADGMSEDEVVRQLAGVLVDGLSHGNWPWTALRGGDAA